MPTLPKPKLALALLTIAALLAAPAAAQATLAYTTHIFHPHVVVAQDNGKGAKTIGAGTNSRVSPNGELVVFERENAAKGKGPEMKLYDVATGKTRTIFTSWRDSYTVAWSPDSTMVAALTGGELGKRTLYVIDVETGKKTRIASGYFSGVSFSPDDEELVFGIGGEEFGGKTNVVRAPVTGGPTSQLTHDGISTSPLWGPQGQIVFVKQLNVKNRRYHTPKNDLFLMNADGKAVKRLTHTVVGDLVFGLFPTAWSASGNQLLAEFGGQDTSYAVAVNPKTGKETNLSPGNSETGFQGVALTPDGKTVLGSIGYFDGGGGADQLKIASIPYKGGKAKVIVKGGFDPSWGG
jgi:Tol biopolymer transport system component